MGVKVKVRVGVRVRVRVGVTVRVMCDSGFMEGWGLWKGFFPLEGPNGPL